MLGTNNAHKSALSALRRASSALSTEVEATQTVHEIVIITCSQQPTTVTMETRCAITILYLFFFCDVGE